MPSCAFLSILLRSVRYVMVSATDEQIYLPAGAYKIDSSICAAIIILQAMSNLPEKKFSGTGS